MRAQTWGPDVRTRDLRRQLRRLPVGDPQDPGYRRLRYTRYADDHLLGFIGPKAEAEAIKDQLAGSCVTTSRWNSSRQDADHPRPHPGGPIPRLRDHRPTRRPARSPRASGRSTGPIALRVPLDVIKAKRAPYLAPRQTRGTGRPCRTWTTTTSSRPTGPNTGASSSTTCSPPTSGGFTGCTGSAQTSMLKTLAAKHRSSVTKMAAKHRANIHTARAAHLLRGPRRTQGQEATGRTVRRDTPETAQGRGPHRPPSRPGSPTARKELINRLLPGRCELCEQPGKVQVHQVRKLASLGQPGRPQPAWAAAHGQETAQDPRGLLALPRHHPRAGTNRDTHGVVTGEPRASKDARVVRAGAAGKGPSAKRAAPRRGLPVPWKAAWSFHQEGDPTAQEWVQDKAIAVLQGKATRVAAGLRRAATRRGLDPPQRAGADACTTYLINKEPYLDYPTALHNGWPSEPPGSSSICTARRCQAAATSADRMEQPEAARPRREKVRAACDEHRQSLADYLAVRSFLRRVEPLEAGH